MPQTTATSKIAYFAAGALVAGLIAAALFFRIRSGDDEERPPIIVRGGSIVFQSGDPNGSADEKQGRRWMPVGDDWQPDHLKGVPVNLFTIAIRGGESSTTCPSMERTREIAVTYTEGGKVFGIKI